MADCLDCDAGVPTCPGPHWQDHAHTADPLCEGCRHRLTAALEALPELYVGAYLALSTGAGNLQRVSGSRSARPPLNEGADQLMRSLLDAVVAPLEAVCEAASLADPVVRGRDGVQIVGACRTLAAHVDTLVGLPPIEYVVWTGEHDPDDGSDVWAVEHLTGVDAAVRIIEECRYARAWLGHTPGREHYVGVHCPACSELQLFRRHGSDTVVCDNCGEMLLPEMMTRWVSMRADDVRAWQEKETG